jgi:hypothetical protein
MKGHHQELAQLFPEGHFVKGALYPSLSVEREARARRFANGGAGYSCAPRTSHQLGINGEAEEKKMERESRTLERRDFSVAWVDGGESRIRVRSCPRRVKKAALSSAPKKSI